LEKKNMSQKKKQLKLSWDDFQALGNPENVEIPETETQVSFDFSVQVRIHKDRKKRKGKTATLIKGLEESGVDITDIAKKLKSHCGVGGSVLDDQDILLQGDQMQKALTYLKKMGFTDCKLSGV
jgi:translation initiation factor 1